MPEEYREQADLSSVEPETEETYEEVKPYRPQKRFLGMTAGQRLVIALMLLITVCVLGTLALLVSGRIALPFP